MRHLALSDLERRWSDVERAVDATPGIDRWCSGPDWQVPVALAFAPGAERLLLATDDGTGFALLARYRTRGRRSVLAGLEPLWGFGTPILGPDPGAVAAELAAELSSLPAWRALVLTGMAPIVDPASGPTGDDGGQRLTLPVATALSTLGPVGFGAGITRQVIDLTGGYDRWLARRSAKFRRNLRRAADAAERLGLRIIDVGAGAGSCSAEADPGLFDRLLAIEGRSWKGRQGSGMAGPEMAAMYRTMTDRLRRRGRLLAHVAVLDGVDVGYILGGIRARRYRGLQLSFTDEVARLSVGNLLQAHQLRQLTDRDLADVYDLGMDFGYKRRWADRAETSVSVVVNR